MTDGTELKGLEHSLVEISKSALAHNYVGGAAELEKALSAEVRGWRSRLQFFDNAISSLRRLSRTAKPDQILELQRKAVKTEHLLNLVIEDATIPSFVTDASIRYVVEDEHLKSSPLVREALVRQAIYAKDLSVRRLAWLHLCRSSAVTKRSQEASRWRFRLPRLRNRQSSKNTSMEGEALKNLRAEVVKNKTVMGPRGSIVYAAETHPDKVGIVRELLTKLYSSKETAHREIVMTLGELGGAEVATFLSDALRTHVAIGAEDEDYQVELVSALTNIGGPDAVEGLLHAAEKGSERVALVALSGLESLATGGAVAIIEYPEPAEILNDEMRNAFLSLSKRLQRLIRARERSAYVSHKANQLLDAVEISLGSVPA